jgi:hypothetical protein
MGPQKFSRILSPHLSNFVQRFLLLGHNRRPALPRSQLLPLGLREGALGSRAAGCPRPHGKGPGMRRIFLAWVANRQTFGRSPWKIAREPGGR